MRRFVCAEIPDAGELVFLAASASHHLLRVTGIAPGEAVEIFDGAGGAAVAELVEVVGGLAQLRVRERIRSPAAGRSVWLLPALLRPAAMETVVRMATELGVVRITPVRAGRVVAKGDKAERWRRIADAAAAQCGRADLPQIDSPVSLQQALSGVGGPWTAVVCAPGDGSALPSGEPVALFIGPEGGWTDEELELAAEVGARALSLGETVLRADTASVVALSRLLG
jgi:16S rRNA (uracil1498-N3)-methyltransferase